MPRRFLSIDGRLPKSHKEARTRTSARREKHKRQKVKLRKKRDRLAFLARRERAVRDTYCITSTRGGHRTHRYTIFGEPTRAHVIMPSRFGAHEAQDGEPIGPPKVVRGCKRTCVEAAAWYPHFLP